MAGPGPICVRCHDDKWRLSVQHMCEACEAEIAERMVAFDRAPDLPESAAVVERVARAVSLADYPAAPWERQSAAWQERYRNLALAAALALHPVRQADERARECSCGIPGLTYDGPTVDCDAHGLPSAAFRAGYREGAQDERDQQRIRGDLCRWCHRTPQRGEEHGTYLHRSPDPDSDPDVGCLDADRREIPHRSTDEAAF